MRGPLAHSPVVGVCGFSGSGKTTLVEALVPRLARRGLAVAVVKHDAHGLTMDNPGKDSDRFFQAGATVVVHDPGQVVRRTHRAPGNEVLLAAVPDLLRDHDIVLVEGHKHTPLPLRLWLLGADGGGAPPEAGAFAATLTRDEDRPARAEDLIAAHLVACQAAQPLCAGLLIGGRSCRMGRPKQLLRSGGTSWAESVHAALFAHTPDVCLLGDGPSPAVLADLPRLPDVPGIRGPIAGMISALRWRPGAAWVFAACDMPLLDAAAVDWLLAQRKPGDWAVLPRSPGVERAEPLCAWYDPRMERLLERCDRPQAVVGESHVRLVDLPAKLADCWLGFNSPDQCEGRGVLDEPLD
ncbi:molybdopterin-guanine dinucleotide biosynthesis protein B [bacterium]|nr:molybdopterin-guanine dinucleotide biosynthesis protein B [bacterium]